MATNQSTIILPGVSTSASKPSFRQDITTTITNKKVIDKLIMMSKEYSLSVDSIVNDILEAYCFPDGVKYLGIKKE